MKIYTKTGDSGTTSLADGRRVSKCCEQLEAYGTVDELNSHVGLLRALATMADDTTQAFLVRIQEELFVVGGLLACAGKLQDTSCQTEDIEAEIDRLTALVPPQRAFVLPAGCQAACQAHICRTICRRAEREILRQDYTVVTAYINRLSDYFFILARYLNTMSDTAEQTWHS